MEWLNKFAQKREQRKRDDRIVTEGASRYWGWLKTELSKTVDAYMQIFPANANGIQVQYDDTNPDRPVVRRQKDNGQGQYNVPYGDVTLEFHPPKIFAIYSTNRPPLLLTTVKGGDGYAILQCEGEDVPMSTGCELILRPLLFDELPEDM